MKQIEYSKLSPYFENLGINIDSVLNHYPSARHVGQFALKTREDYTDFAVDVFYQPNPNRELGYDNYFAIYKKDGKAYITSAAGIRDMVFSGVADCDGNVLYARYRHDFRSTKDGDIMVDGGMWLKCHDPGPLFNKYYMMGRTLGSVRILPMSLIVVDGHVFEVEKEDLRENHGN